MKKKSVKEVDEEKRGVQKCPVPQPKVCPDCDGLGYVAVRSYHNECWKCDGTGEVWE